MAKVYVGSARGDERGKAYGGSAGDQTGREVCVHAWERHEKGWRTLRAKDAAAREKLAAAMEAACANGNIGYDQWQRDTLLAHARKAGYDPGQVTQACETDCSSLVRVCCAYAYGRDIVAEATGARFYTGNLVQVLEKTGLFDEMTGEAYGERSDYLMRGDIQCTRTQGHVVIVLNDGSKAGETPGRKRTTLRRGASGTEVRAMQWALISLGYDLGSWGADGRFGAATGEAVIAFQRANGLTADGICGPETWSALDTAGSGANGRVRIEGGNCHVRLGAGREHESIGVARAGETLDYAGETAQNGWHRVRFEGQTGWVSGKYGRMEAGQE